MSGLSINQRHGVYDQTYFRTMTNSGPAASEHIEMETMMNKAMDRDEKDM